MTATQHVDEQTLLSAAADPSLHNHHIEMCPRCQRDLAAWRRIAGLTRERGGISTTAEGGSRRSCHRLDFGHATGVA